jgi:sulfotransferase family protein
VISDSIRQKLKYVSVSDRSVDLAYFPDFLIIGPQRTGTTWLHANLRYHPHIMLSEPKELFFFSSLKPPSTPRFGSSELAEYVRFFHEPPWRVALRNLISVWRYREWYRPRVRGEATASYAALDRDVIDDITTLRPEINAILMIRNPIDRAWSHAKKDLARNRQRRLEDVSAQEFEQFFSDPYQRRCARYVDNIDTWSAALQPGHLHVAVFDDIDARPEKLLLEVMSFLGVRSDRRYIRPAVRQAVNPTGSSRIPERYRRYLEDLFAEELKSLQRRFGLSWSSEHTASTPAARQLDASRRSP